MSIAAIPKGYHSVSPYLIVHNATYALEFYQRAFNAGIKTRLEMPDGSIGHAEIVIGDSIIMLSSTIEEAGFYPPEHYGGSPVSLFLYVDDVDTIFSQALGAGATEEQPLTNMFWGDRMGKLQDPFGYRWSVASQVEIVHHEEIKARLLKLYSEVAE
jgi:PhnB protein